MDVSQREKDLPQDKEKVEKADSNRKKTIKLLILSL